MAGGVSLPSFGLPPPPDFASEFAGPLLQDMPAINTTPLADSRWCNEDYGYYIVLGDPNETLFVACECKTTREADVAAQWLPNDIVDDSFKMPDVPATVLAGGRRINDRGGMRINNVEIDLYATGADPANAEHPSVWISTPPYLADYWSTEFPFDDPLCEWVYVNVERATAPKCVPFPDANWFSFTMEGAYLVSGFLPYVAYKILSASDSAGARVYRVRLWVGLMHHFSFFVPPPQDYLDHSVRWGTEVVELYATATGVAWDPADTQVSARGRFAEMYLGFVERMFTQVSWDGGSLGPSNWLPVRYDCDPTLNVDSLYPYRLAYEDPSTGDPTALCFSDRWAFENSESDMCAFLGASVWGEVCVTATLDGDPPRNNEVGEQAFRQLFPNGFVSVGWSLQAETQDYSGASKQAKVERWFTLQAADAAPVSRLIERVEALRGTPEGRYVIRNWDVNRLADAAKAQSVGESCCTVAG